MGSVIVGFIDTAAGRAALEEAIEESHLRSARLLVVNSMFGGDRESEEEYVGLARAMESVEKRLTDAGLDYEIHQFVRGQSPAEDVCQAATDFEADLVVIGTRRRSAAGKMLLGSNALEILHDAPCPVLCVRVD
jgi:nucleotide-binding universal stress UspA family protein